MNYRIAYIIGKISGLPIEEAKKNFEDKKNELVKLGYDEVLTPFDAVDNFMETSDIDCPEPGSKEEWQLGMAASISHIMCLRILNNTEVHVLDNFRDSKGAAIELDLIDKVGIKVVYPLSKIHRNRTLTPPIVQN